MGEDRQRLTAAELPPAPLITDHYAYNDGTYKNQDFDTAIFFQDLGLHWVGDLGIDCQVDVESDSGTLMLDLVEGGAHFICSIDVASGEAKLECKDPSVTFVTPEGSPVKTPSAKTNLRGAEQYRIEYVNADDRIHLWINNKLAEFDAAEYLREGYVIPKYSEQDAGDAEPAGIGAENLEIRVNRLKIVRDIYYTSVYGDPIHDGNNISNLENETQFPPLEILRTYVNPEEWSTTQALKIFKTKKQQKEPMFRLVDSEDPDMDQFLPMGDNSPQSLDGRVWPGPKYVERDMLIGRALFIYWPHTLNKPIKYFPNFRRMGFIR